MYQITKRIIDVMVAGILLVATLPVFLIIILILWIKGDGQVFYLQERVGFKNRKFYIFKFATMVKDSLTKGTGEVTIKNDPRVTPFGRILRKTKLNELPQLVNVLKGDMTLIGPRPLMDKGFLRYTPEVQKIIYNIKPGLTGIGSVIFRDEETFISHFRDFEKLYLNINNYKGRLEEWYQQNQGYKTDFLLICLTVYSIIFPSQNITYKIFKNLPEPENPLDFALNVRYIQPGGNGQETLKDNRQPENTRSVQ